AGLVGQKIPVTIQSGVEAFLKHFFRLRSGRAELQHSERPPFGQEFVKERQKLFPKSGPLIIFAPLLFITCAREVVKKFPFGDSGRIFLDFVFLQRPGNARGFWNLLADGVAVGIQDLVFIGKDRLQWQAVGFLERPLQQRGRHLKTNKIVIAVWSIALSGYFQDVEAKFRFDMREGVIFVRYAVAIFLLKLGIEEGYGTVGCNGMTCVICGIVCECAQRKSIIIQLLRFPRVAEERNNEITTSHIVGEIAEKDAAMWVIAQVLNNGAPVGVSVCLAQFVRCGMWEALEQDGFDVGIPS